MTSLAKPTTTLLLREALYQTISCSVQELRDAVGQILVATVDGLPVGTKTGPSDRSVYNFDTRTMVLLADRIPAGQEALAIAQEIGLWHGQTAAEAVCAHSLSRSGTPSAPEAGATQLASAGWTPADEYTKQLLDCWHALPLDQKLRALDPVEMVRESWRVEEWLDHALPPGVSTLWSVYDQNGEEIGRADTRRKALEKAWLNPANQHPTLAQQEENEKFALELRRQALELLKQAQTLDSLKPYVVRHETPWEDNEQLVWAATRPSLEEAQKRVGYQEWQNEKVFVQETFPLEQLTGADLNTRWNKAQGQDSSMEP